MLLCLLIHMPMEIARPMKMMENWMHIRCCCWRDLKFWMPCNIITVGLFIEICTVPGRNFRFSEIATTIFTNLRELRLMSNYQVLNEFYLINMKILLACFWCVSNNRNQADVFCILYLKVDFASTTILYVNTHITTIRAKNCKVRTENHFPVINLFDCNAALVRYNLQFWDFFMCLQSSCTIFLVMNSFYFMLHSKF